MNPADLRYSKEHEWLRLESQDLTVVGITEFATESLGDVVFVELPEKGSDLTQSEKMGEIESVKAVSDLYSPVSGSVVERNDQLIDSPQLVNERPYDAGWMVRIRLAAPAEVDALMTSEQYEAFLVSQEQ